MPASDDELEAIIRRMRLAMRALQERAEIRMLGPWQSADFGLADETWRRWAEQHPPQRIPRRAEEWTQLHLPFNETQLNIWASYAADIADATQYQVATATQTFLSRYGQAAVDATAIPLGLPPTDVNTEALRGVPATTVWSRPATELRISVLKGAPLGEARQRSANLARTLLSTDTQLAHIRGSVRYLADRARQDNIVGYRRVPRGGRSCALCLLASTQRYHYEALMPIHDNCHCVVEPIYGDRDPGQVIAPRQLRAVHARIEEATGSSDLSGGNYREAVIVHHHGEIGPVLSYRKHAFTGPSDLAESN